MEMILETKALAKGYNEQKAVNEVDLQIPKGKIYGFLGPNGAGKTTSIRMLLGLIQPSKGHVEVFGKALQKNKLSILGKVGSLVEAPSYYGHLNAIENLKVYSILLGVPKKRIYEVLEIVRLTDAAKKNVKHYSLGMKQRLGIAIALLGDPELLILDEPTNGLDPEGIHEIRRLIKNLSAERGITILISSHLLSEIDQIADYVGIISKGNLVFQNHISVLREKAQANVQILMDRPEKGLKEILKHGIAAEMENLTVSIKQTDDSTVSSAIKTLVEHDISVYRVEEQKHSLEDIFLNVVKEEGVHV